MSEPSNTPIYANEFSSRAELHTERLDGDECVGSLNLEPLLRKAHEDGFKQGLHVGLDQKESTNKSCYESGRRYALLLFINESKKHRKNMSKVLGSENDMKWQALQDYAQSLGLNI